MYGAKVEQMFAEIDTNGDKIVSEDEFKALLKKADMKLKSLPATAQVKKENNRSQTSKKAEQFLRSPASRENISQVSWTRTEIAAIYRAKVLSTNTLGLSPTVSVSQFSSLFSDRNIIK